MSERTPREPATAPQSKSGSTTTAGSGSSNKSSSGYLSGKPFAEQEAALCVHPRGREEQVPPWKRSPNKTDGSPRPSSQQGNPYGIEPPDHTPPGPDPLQGCEDPNATRAIVRDVVSVELGDAVTAYIRDLCHAEALAMNRFIHTTGGSPTTSLGQADFFGLVADVVTGGLVQDGLEALAKRSGRLHSKLAEMLFGGITGVAWGVLVSLIFDDDNDELVHKALAKAGKEAEAAMEKLHDGGKKMTARWQTDRSQMLRELDLLNSVEPMKDIEAWAKGEIGRLEVADKHGDLLFGRLIERWLLERARDDEDADRGVNPVSHEEARPRVLEAGSQAGRDPVTDGKRITKPDLFLNQMTYLLSKLGLGAEGATKFFHGRFTELRKGLTPAGVAARMKREAFLVRETVDEKRWHAMTTWTHYRAPERVQEPPGENAALEVRLDLKAHNGVLALRSMDLTYVGQGPDGAPYRSRTQSYEP